MAEFNLDDLKKTLTDAAEVVTKKTGDFVSVQKLKGQIYALGHSVDKKYQELGAVVFDEYAKGDKVNDESAIVCEEISQINANIAELRAELASRHGCKMCPVCEAEVPLEAMFCMKCGAQMPEEECECESEDCECASEDCQCGDDVVKAKEALKDVGKKVKKVGKEAVKETTEMVKDASKEVKKVGKATAKGAVTAAKGTSKAVKEAVDEVKKDLEKSEE